jgi:hypothetical protein
MSAAPAATAAFPAVSPLCANSAAAAAAAAGVQVVGSKAVGASWRLPNCRLVLLLLLALLTLLV